MGYGERLIFRDLEVLHDFLEAELYQGTLGLQKVSLFGDFIGMTRKSSVRVLEAAIKLHKKFT